MSDPFTVHDDVRESLHPNGSVLYLQMQNFMYAALGAFILNKHTLVVTSTIELAEIAFREFTNKVATVMPIQPVRSRRRSFESAGHRIDFISTDEVRNSTRGMLIDTVLFV